MINTLKQNYIKVIGSMSLLGLLIFFSCSEDFTNLEQEYVLTTEDSFNNEQDYFDVLIGAYDLLASSWVTQMVGEFASDNSLAAGEFGCNDTPKWQRLENFTHTVENDLVGEVWDDNFAGISRCNFFLDNKDKTEFEGRDIMVAEVRFLRAYFTFELARYYGGLPLKNSSFVVGDELDIPRSSLSETYAFIENDLVDAIADLPTTQNSAGRVTKGAALALLGKVHIYQEEWTQAIAVLEQVTTLGYQLVDDFASQFTTGGENGIESVFEIQFSNAEVGNWSFDNSEEGNITAWYSGPRLLDDAIYAGGYSFNIPQSDLVDLYMTTDTRKQATILDIFAYTGFQDETELAENRDYTVGCGTDTGYYYNKIIQRNIDHNGTDNIYSRSSTNYRVIRYADVLLMLAEAYNRGNVSDATAREYLQEVVDRAHGLGTIVIGDSGQNLTQRIWDERRLEFAGEGHRYFDLIRTGQAAANLSGFQTGKHEVFPIPQDEIDFSQGNWTQNPGW